MTSNVGLNTPRGSGTSGYVQRNLSALRPRDQQAPYPSDASSLRHKQRQPDASILEHSRKREIELKVFELRDELEDEGKDEDEIDAACDALREKLEKEAEDAKGKGQQNGSGAKGLKSHQVHELARAKIEESEKLRRALGIRADYEEGSHWKRQDENVKEEQNKNAREARERERDD